MNPVFWILVILGAIAFWFVLAPIFQTLGDILMEFWDRAKEEMTETDEDEEEN